MGRSIRPLAITLVALLLAAATVSAQSAPWRIVQAGDGTLYLLKDGAKSLITPAVIADDELAAIPDADPIYGDLPQPAAQIVTVVTAPVVAPAAPPAEPPAPPVVVPPVQPTPTPVPPAVVATRESPVPMGAVGHFAGGWDVVVTGTTPDASGIVLKENQFNTPPKPGERFFIARVRATYTGTGSKRSDRASFTAVGTSSVAYTTFGNSCGVYPDPLTENETFSGGTITGNLCWAIRSEDANSLVMFDSSFGTRPEARVFMSVH